MSTSGSIMEKDILCYTLSYTIKRKRVLKVPTSKQKPLNSKPCTWSQKKCMALTVNWKNRAFDLGISSMSFPLTYFKAALSYLGRTGHFSSGFCNGSSNPKSHKACSYAPIARAP